jgi:hypothetical protein
LLQHYPSSISRRMTRQDSTYKSSVWDRSFLLTICTLFAGGVLYSIDHLLAEEPTDDSLTQTGGDGDGDGGDD